MNKKRKQTGGGKPERKIVIRSVKRDPPDLKKLSRALVTLAIAQAEADARSEHESEKSAEDGK